MALVAEEPFILTPIDNVLPRYHVSKLFFFPSSKSVTTTETVEALRTGLEKTVEAFPLLLGTVQELQPASDQGQKGRLCVSAPWHTMSDIFSVQDLSEDETLDYSSLREEAFPIHKLDTATLLPQDSKGLKPNAKSVMLAKVNKIRGGLIVVHTICHGFMDGGGMAVIAKIWAAFCRGEDGSKYLTRDVLDRSRLMWGTANSQVADFPELAHASRTHTGTPATVVSPQGTQYETFFFSRKKLDELKEMASCPGNPAESSDWISTSDALCALLTRCIQSIRDERTPLTLGLAMDIRAYLDPPLPADYIGNAVHMINISVPPSAKEEGPNAVAATAHQIRRKIQGVNDTYIRRVIGALNSENIPDISNVFHARVSLNGGRFLTITSWAKQGFYELDWGAAIGARIERVRVPNFQYPNLVLIAPLLKGPGFTEEEDGGIEVTLELEAEELGRLKGDVLFQRFAKWQA